MPENTVLMGTFLSNERVPRNAIRLVFENFNSSRVFVFELESEDPETNRFLITYNITDLDKKERLQYYIQKYRNTVQLHRNKESNTLYTINSLNEVVIMQNGKIDQNYKVDWSQYNNCCLVYDGEHLKVLKTKLYDIVDL